MASILIVSAVVLTFADPVSAGPSPCDPAEGCVTAPQLKGDWVGVQSLRRPLAYDVPSSWTVVDGGTLTGFEWEDSTTDLGWDQVIFSGSAVGPDRTPIDESCEWSPHATAAIGSNGGEVDQPDTAAIAEFTAGQWAGHAYGLTDGTPAPFTVVDAEPFIANGLQGHLAKADVTPPCGPAKAVVWVFSFLAPDLVSGVYNLILYGDEPTGAADDPLTDEMIEAMFLSVRESAVPDEPTTTDDHRRPPTSCADDMKRCARSARECHHPWWQQNEAYVLLGLSGRWAMSWSE